MGFGRAAGSADSDVAWSDLGEERPHLPLRQVRRTCRCVSALSCGAGGGGQPTRSCVEGVVSARACETGEVWFVPILDRLASAGVRFVVVGSAARMLVGEVVGANDLDLVIDGSPPGRPTLLTAMLRLEARVEQRCGFVPMDSVMCLPWDWGWRARTPLGDVDLITRFIDGTTIDEHDELADAVVLPSGSVVWCNPTRWAG